MSWSAGNVNVATDNIWSNNAGYQSGNCATTNYHSVSGAWPTEAQAVIDNSGMEAAYDNVLGNTYDGNNLALKATASASSSTSGHAPNLGNDVGNKTYWESGSASNNPWFMLDLGNTYVIKKLELEPALLTDVDLTNFQIQASNSASFASFSILAAQNETQFRHRTDVGYNDKFWYIEHDKNAYRYIRVYKTTGTELALADLRVYVKASNTSDIGNVFHGSSMMLQNTGVLGLFINSHGKKTRITIPVVYGKRNFIVNLYTLDGRLTWSVTSKNLDVSLGNNNIRNRTPLKGAYVLHIKTDIQKTDKKLIFY